MSILDPSRGIWIPGTLVRKLRHNSYLVKTTAGAVYHCTRKHLWERQVTKPDLEPPKADNPVMHKAQVCTPPQHKSYAEAAALRPNPAAVQCAKPSTLQQSTPNPVCNPSPVQPSTEVKVPAPPSVPAAKVPASQASHTSLATRQSSRTRHAPERLIEKM